MGEFSDGHQAEVEPQKRIVTAAGLVVAAEFLAALVPIDENITIDNTQRANNIAHDLKMLGEFSAKNGEIAYGLAYTNLNNLRAHLQGIRLTKEARDLIRQKVVVFLEKIGVANDPREHEIVFSFLHLSDKPSEQPHGGRDELKKVI